MAKRVHRSISVSNLVMRLIDRTLTLVRTSAQLIGCIKNFSVAAIEREARNATEDNGSQVAQLQSAIQMLGLIHQTLVGINQTMSTAGRVTSNGSPTERRIEREGADSCYVAIRRPRASRRSVTRSGSEFHIRIPMRQDCRAATDDTNYCSREQRASPDRGSNPHPAATHSVVVARIRAPESAAIRRGELAIKMLTARLILLLKHTGVSAGQVRIHSHGEIKDDGGRCTADCKAYRALAHQRLSRLVPIP
jgi:hypothetical protein